MVLNVGNTRLAVGVFVAGELEKVQRVHFDERDKIEEIVRDAWSRIERLDNPSIAGASVNPAAMEAVEHLVSGVCGEKVEWIGRDIDLPMRVLTEPPSETGVDRVMNLAAAFEQLRKACVVIDAGTAITIDCCNDKGDFLGGAIAPGVAMQLDALHERTARLPRVELAAPQGVFGRSTREAIRQGVFHGVRGMVKELVENYATELGFWPEVIATGGDAPKLFEGWEDIVHAISPDLTLYGIALSYANHHIKHGT